jgi:S1-C subfamily serine protease
MNKRLWFALVLISPCIISSGLAQIEAPTSVPTAVNAKLVLDAAGPEQRRSLANVYLIACPTSTGAELGTGFLINRGIIVTNAHVTATCNETNLLGVSTASEQIHFSKVIKDQDLDLALLVPSKPLSGGYSLAVSDSITPGTQVSTWGYPFYYNGISPLLSVGYISGYRVVSTNGKDVKHLVINGAFNHGNSGGALLESQQTDVIGIVVATYHFYPPEVKQIIDGLSSYQSGFMIGSLRQADGSQKPVSEAQITAMVLNEFYEKTQVMIGEAIAVSELTKLIKDNSQDLPKKSGVVKVSQRLAK